VKVITPALPTNNNARIVFFFILDFFRLILGFYHSILPKKPSPAGCRNGCADVCARELSPKPPLAKLRYLFVFIKTSGIH